jgi:phage terminase small subunit
LLNKKYITEEINHRLEEMKSKRTADAVEILEYLTSVMRGELKDQFGLEAPLSERTKAATELAKRQIDIPNRLGGKKDAEVKITLDWKRD